MSTSKRLSRMLIVLLSIAMFIAGALISGLIGNGGSNAFLWLWNQVIRSIETNSWPWIITLVILITGLAALLYSWWHNRILNYALTTANNLLELDDSLLRLLASWIPAKDHEAEMKLLLAELLRDASAEFQGYVHRAYILLPDSSTGGKYLRIWAHFGMPQESIERIKFYIGNNRDEEEQRGVAGEAFLSSQVMVGHIILKEGLWESDNAGFITFSRKKLPPPYRSFICVPIIGPSPNSTEKEGIASLGVACFDSPNQTIFDTYETKTILRVFARRIAAALLIYQKLDGV